MAGADEEQHLDRFDVENDFEGGQYIGGEFFFQSKRQKRQQTEDDRIYGIFADGSDSDDEYRRRGQREKADYSRPVAFVSKGQVVNKQEDQQAQQKNEDKADMDEDARPSFATLRPASTTSGLGASSAAGLGSAASGLGFKSAGTTAEDADDADEEGVLPTAFGARIKAKAAQRRQEEQQQHKQEKQRKVNKATDPGFASFEKHTKGIGMKLLQKMGYKEGHGLGRDKQGIAKPVEVKLRPKNMGMGFGTRHQEEEEKPVVQGPAQAPAPGAAPGPGQRLWKKKNADARVRREYKSASEVLAEAPAKPLAAQPILDMRGPHARLITNLEHLNTQDEGAGGDKVPMPELQHNLQLLVDLAEADIQKLDARLRHEQDTATLLGREKTRLEEEVARQEAQLQHMAHITSEVARCEAGGPSGLPLQAVEVVYSGLLKLHREEYIMYSLASAALSHALPRLAELLQGWSPLEDPTRGAAEFARWRPLLEPQGSSTGSSAYGGYGPSGAAMFTGMDADAAGGGQDPYVTLASELLLPPLRQATTNWEPREPEPLLGWMETWEPLLPRPTLAHILDMLVMPRLRRAVNDWEPRQETVPIHAWLHPWLPYLGTQLEELYPGIRHKLGVALQAWHPSDGSALVLLRPWHRVFDPADWDALLLRSIVPKLAMALQSLVINPAAQDMGPFNWVMAWHDVLPVQHMVALLDTGFFPKWHQVLHFWLSNRPNYDEVTRWYLGWKSSFPSSLLDQERVRRQFNAALDMMNQAVDGQAVPAPATGPASAFASRWASDGAQQEAAPPLPRPTLAGGAEPSLKDMVAHFAEENSIQFMPKFGRYQDGLQVYSFGSTSIVLDNNQSVIRALIRDRWAPVTLDTLMQQNKK